MRLARPVRGWSAPRMSSKPSRWFSTMLTTRASAAGFPALKSSSKRSEDAAKYPFLSPPHRRRGARQPGRMVVSEHVQSPMHDQPQQLLAGGDSLPLRILPGHFGADIDITDD